MNIPWKLLGYAALIGGAAYAVHWHAESNYKRGYDARDAIAVKAELAATEKALKTTNAWQAAVDVANKRGEDREKKLLADNAAARGAADGLRNELTGLRARIPHLTEEAVRRYADTASVVLGECTAAYSELAGTLDKVDSDRQRLEEAWPQ